MFSSLRATTHQPIAKTPCRKMTSPIQIQVPPLTIIIALLLLPLLLYIYHKLHPTPLPGIPYNPSSTSKPLGDIPHLKSLARQTHDTSTLVFSLSKNHKSPNAISQLLFTSFSKPWIIIDDPREIEDILVRRNREFDRSELTAAYFRPMLPRSSIAQFTTPSLRAQKRLWSDVMSSDFLKKVVAGNILASGRELVQLWRIKAVNGDGRPFNPAHDFECTALDAIWVAVLGSKIGVVRNEINKLKRTSSSAEKGEVGGKGGSLSSDGGLDSAATIQKAMAYMNKIVSDGNHSLIPALSTLRLQLSPSYRRFMKVTYSEVQNLMKKSCERFERINTSTTTTTTEHGEELDTCAMDLVLRREILTAKKSSNPNPSDPTTDPAMLQELLLMLLGGHDSTTNTLTWFAKFASMFPDSQTTLRNTLHTALGTSDKGGGITVEELTAAKIMDTDIPYLDAYIQELVRYSTTAGIITRTALVDTVVLGCPIPKGTHLLLNTRVDSSHVSIAKTVSEDIRSATSQAAQARRIRGGLLGESGRDLDTFNPARWLVKSESTGKEVFDVSALPSSGFGGGLRGCFGKRLALMELRIMVAVLVLAFEFLPLEDEKMNSMDAEERIFRRPKFCQVRLRVL